MTPQVLILEKLKVYISNKQFSLETAVACLKDAVRNTECPYFLNYYVRKEYNEHEGILKLGKLDIGNGKSFSKNEAQQLAYIHALKRLKFRSIEELLIASDLDEDEPTSPINTQSDMIPDSNASITDLVVMETSTIATNRIKHAVSILHNSVFRNRMTINWDNAMERNLHKVTVFVLGKRIGSGLGSTKTKAKRNAACDALFNYLYKKNEVLQITQDDDSEVWIPYSRVNYLFEQTKRRGPYIGPKQGVRNPYFFAVVQNLIDSHAWSELNNELIFGPGLSVEHAEIIQFVGEESNLSFKKKKHSKAGDYYVLYRNQLPSDMVKYLKRLGGCVGKYRLVPKSEIREIDSQNNKRFINQKNTAGNNKRNIDKISQNTNKNSYGNNRGFGDMSGQRNKGYNRTPSHDFNMSSSDCDETGFRQFSAPDRRTCTISSPNERQFNQNLSSGSVTRRVGSISDCGDQELNRMSSYYDRVYSSPSTPYESGFDQRSNHGDVGFNPTNRHNDRSYGENSRVGVTNRDNSGYGQALNQDNTGFNQIRDSDNRGFEPSFDRSVEGFNPALDQNQGNFTSLSGSNNGGFNSERIYDDRSFNQASELDQRGFNRTPSYHHDDFKSDSNRNQGFILQPDSDGRNFNSSSAYNDSNFNLKSDDTRANFNPISNHSNQDFIPLSDFNERKFLSTSDYDNEKYNRMPDSGMRFNASYDDNKMSGLNDSDVSRASYSNNGGRMHQISGFTENQSQSFSSEKGTGFNKMYVDDREFKSMPSCDDTRFSLMSPRDNREFSQLPNQNDRRYNQMQEDNNRFYQLSRNEKGFDSNMASHDGGSSYLQDSAYAERRGNQMSEMSVPGGKSYNPISRNDDRIYDQTGGYVEGQRSADNSFAMAPPPPPRFADRYVYADKKNRNEGIMRGRSVKRRVRVKKTILHTDRVRRDERSAVKQPLLRRGAGIRSDSQIIRSNPRRQRQNMQISRSRLIKRTPQSENLTPPMGPPNQGLNSQIMGLNFLSKKLAQNAIHNNVKNILANARKLSNIAQARHQMEQFNPGQMPQNVNRPNIQRSLVKRIDPKMIRNQRGKFTKRLPQNMLHNNVKNILANARKLSNIAEARQQMEQFNPGQMPMNPNIHNIQRSLVKRMDPQMMKNQRARFLTKKLAQNALHNNVKNILANARKLSNIAEARQEMEQFNPGNMPPNTNRPNIQRTMGRRIDPQMVKNQRGKIPQNLNRPNIQRSLGKKVDSKMVKKVNDAKFVVKISNATSHISNKSNTNKGPNTGLNSKNVKGKMNVKREM